MLLRHKADINAQCKQKYTPFLLAVRLGNVEVIKYLLRVLIKEKKLMGLQEINLRTGIGMNTAFHIAAAKTNFLVLFELDSWGGDIFIRNKENKTCFQVVNNNLLMLKIVKKLEKKYFISNFLMIELSKICPHESRLISQNSVLLNSG